MDSCHDNDSLKGSTFVRLAFQLLTFFLFYPINFTPQSPLQHSYIPYTKLLSGSCK